MVQSIKLTCLMVNFYKTTQGNEPVKRWLQSLEKKDRIIIGENIRTLQFGWPVGMPLVANLGHGLWEIRSNLLRGRIARIIFFIDKGGLIFVHGFIKKTQKTPGQDLSLAQKRKSMYLYQKE